MRKKMISGVLALLPAALFALIAGDEAAMLQVDYIKNNPVYIDKAKYRSSEPYKNLRIILSTATFFPNAQRQLMSIERLVERYKAAEGLEAVAISPQLKNVITNWADKLPLVQVAIAVDNDGKTLSKYLEGMMTNRAFIIDADQRIIWDGDAEDVAQVVKEMYAGDFNLDNFRTISQWQRDLTLSAAGGNLNEVMALSDKILRVNPGNSIALRGYLYAAENLDIPAQQIFQYLNNLRHMNVSGSANLYFAIINTCRQLPQFSPELPQLAVEFAERFSSDGELIGAMEWAYLDGFPQSPAALSGASVFNAVLEKLPGTPYIYSIRALYLSRIGRLGEALELQMQAVNAETAADEKLLLEERAEFYRMALNLQSK